MAPSGSLKRVGSTVGANIYGQAVTIATQIILVPILLHAWGIEHYGVWLVLSALPVYLTLSDFGFTFIAKNEMTMKMASGDLQGTLITYHSVFVLLNVVVGTVTLLVIALVFSIRLGSIFDLGPVTETQAKLVLILFALFIAGFQYFQLLHAAVRAAGRPASETLWVATSRLGDATLTAATALLGGDLMMAAAAMLLNRIVFTTAIYVWLRSIAPTLQLGWTYCSLKEIRHLLHPSLSYMFIPIGTALLIQGPVVILGLISVPAHVVLFSTSRTLARLGTSTMNIINLSVVPEYSRLFGQKDNSGFMHIVKIHLALAAVGTIIYVIFTIFAGDFILKLWTNGKLLAEEPFFAILVFSIGAEMLWTALFWPLSAINRHMKASNAFAVVSVIGIAACYLGTASHGLTGTAIALLAAHLVMIGIASEQLLRERPQ